jgi:SET domain
LDNQQEVLQQQSEQKIIMTIFPLVILSLFLQLNDAFVSLSATTKVAPLSSTHTFAATAGVSLDDCLLSGVETMGEVMTPEFFESSPSLKTMYSQIVKNVEVKESSIPGAGLGLFAKKNIKSGTIVSFYPAHSLGVEEQEKSIFSCSPADTEYFQANPPSGSSYLHCTDQPLFKRTSLLAQASNDFQDTPLYLDVNPQKEVVPGWVSHFINDGAVVESNSEQGVLEYYQKSGQTKNCIHIPWGPSPVMATVTTKKVKKGEELFTCYGGVYWLGVLLNVRGEEGVQITNEIQKKIQETATDLAKSMQGTLLVYAKQAEEMETEFRKLHRS